MKKNIKKDIDTVAKSGIGGPYKYTFTDLLNAALDKAYCAFIDHPCDVGVEILDCLMEVKVIMNNGREKNGR